MKLKKSVIVILSSIFLLSTASSQELAEMPIEVRKLSEKTIVLSLGYLQTIALAASKGIVVIDSNRGQSAGAEIRRRIAEEFGRDDFAYLINTHYHFDHTGGNKAFADLVIIGHERCIEGLHKNEARDFAPNANRYREIAAEFREKQQTLAPDSEEAKDIPGTIAYLLSTADDFDKGFISVPPSITFNERMTLDLGDLTLKLRYFGNAHSDTDILIFVPEEKILLMGDIYTSARIPNFPENTQLEVPLWIANLNAFLSAERDIKHIISGHTNNDMPIEDWKDRRDYIEILWNGITAAHKEGLTLEEIQARFALKKSFPKFINVKHEWDGKNIHEHNVKMLWMQLAKNKEEEEFPILEGSYLGQKPPGMTPEPFALNLLPDKYWWHSAPAFSPDGKEVYFSAFIKSEAYSERIMYMKIENGLWIPPKVTSFSEYFEGGPCFTSDGKKIFFSSARPMVKGGERRENRDIWYVERNADGWGEPKHTSFNTDTWEDRVYISDLGNIYYKSNNDIYRVKMINEKFSEPERLSDAINSEYGEQDPCIAPDESFIIFYSSHPGHLGKENGDLYISFKRKDDTWTKAVNMGPTFNKGHIITRFPRLSPDGKYLFFSKLIDPRNDKIFWVDAKIIEELKPEEFK